MRRVLYCVLCLAVSQVAGCGHKPSYSEIDSNQSGKAANQSSPAPGGPEKPTALPGEPAHLPETAPASAPGEQKPVPLPAFFDSATGQIKDLPGYPRARRTNIQFGPLNGYDTMLITLTTRDPFDKVVAFYDQAVKSNGWTIVENSRDPNKYQWTLLKESGQGMIVIAKEEQRPLVYVTLDRVKSSSPPK
jgi:hypothetical protein